MTSTALTSAASLVQPKGGRQVARFLFGRLLVGITLLGSGCTMPQRAFQPEQDLETLSDVSFLHYLASVPVVSVDEGMRAVLMLVGGGSQWPSFERRYEELRRRGALRPSWRLTPQGILDKGTLAYMIRTVCKIPRSVTESLASVTGVGDRRYALKTVIHAGVMPYGLAQEPLTGGELLSALTNSERLVAPGGNGAS